LGGRAGECGGLGTLFSGTRLLDVEAEDSRKGIGSAWEVEDSHVVEEEKNGESSKNVTSADTESVRGRTITPIALLNSRIPKKDTLTARVGNLS
jgi:hypothetical protein